MGESTKLSAEQCNALACLSSLDGASDYYLAGDTGVAAHLNHRTSVDLEAIWRQGVGPLSRVEGVDLL